MSDAEKVKAAIDTVARWHLESILNSAIADGQWEWAELPDLTGADFDRVTARIQQIAVAISPAREAYDAAHEHLVARVDRQEATS